ncbi:Pyridoxamine 5'-phosphate oxidase [Pseudovibrio axinellae]|uniref:Pyridoxamine 5'-phosphate oxidase n=1 Tax=Pseudovibrio axinellae TaxID=989403 RepID=A0A165XPD3_9HYPH|nr:pyridoxamine 5'-phosphate oxidase family protein [Pseudovibrio axinellae]KZL17913.1 Pyridoxamine 5'-phosphate oxidase [Pseudovibrio axinellae]SER58040.1 hypothetical protein SAMN05421798_11311 [Pseudovibrio axinellae]
MNDQSLRPDNLMGHDGELYMREKYPSSYHWDEFSLPKMLREAISPPLAHFIEAQPFFFIATSSAEGHCDASFRGREYSPNGIPLLACKVFDEKTLVFPDFSGNGLYQTLGNMHSNPHIGMLFVDFTQQRRVRVNGKAQVRKLNKEDEKLWPNAQAVISVTVEQAYGNCRARIPKMKLVEGSDQAF